jgi:transglutaminase-like putative cysteine protease
MHFAIRYLTEYRYDGPVTDNLNALRVRPAVTPTQRVDDFGVRVSPETRLDTHLDYFGTSVTEFGISRPHEQLAVDVRARVVTFSGPPAPETGWEAVRDPAYTAAGTEFLMPFGAEPEPGAIDDLLRCSEDDAPVACLVRLGELIPDRFEYKAGVTYVGSTVQDLLDGGAGVCQDFAHLALLVLRRHGIAARYVSGYLFAPPGGDEASDSAEVETHAWVEALLPRDPGEEPVWIGMDPTNACLTGERHVKIGHGRHYSDVPPIKGVYRGTAESELTAVVQMTRTDAPGRPAAAA